MNEPRQKKRFLRCRSNENKKTYNRQRNLAKLIGKAQKNHYRSLKVKDLNDNKNFWKILKPCLSKIVTTYEKTILVENKVTIFCDTEIAETLSSYSWVPNKRPPHLFFFSKTFPTLLPLYFVRVTSKPFVRKNTF